MRLKLLDLTLVARDLLVEHMGYGVLVLDEGHRIVDANPPARTFLGKSEDVVGSAAVEMLAGLAEMLEVGQGQIKVVLPQSQRTCEGSLLPLDRDRTRRDGYLVMLLDISERKKPEAKEAADQKNSRTDLGDGHGGGYLYGVPDGVRDAADSGFSFCLLQFKYH